MRFALVGLAVLYGQVLPAQTMEIRLRDETSRAPIVGAIVRLLDQRGPVAQVFAICGDLPTHRELVLRIFDGKRPLTENPVKLSGDGVVWIEVRMPQDATTQRRNDAK